MPETKTITVHFTGSITFKSAPESCEGKPYPLNGQTHQEAMAEMIEDVIFSDLVHDPDDLEPCDYVQDVEAVKVTGVSASIEGEDDGTGGD